MGILDGRTAIIAGASSGVGYGAALRFAEEGANVIAGARRKEKLDQLADEAKKRGFDGQVTPVVCDISKDDDLDHLVAVCMEKYQQIDILACIAQGGLFDQHDFLETTPENALLFFEQGPLYTLKLVQKCFPYMKEKHYGRILLCGSGAGMTYVENATSYSMAKAAIISLSRTISHELGPYGITTNCFLPVSQSDAFSDPNSPGEKKYLAMMESTIPIHHFGTPYEDVSPLLAFLASEKSGYVNGQTISICGGCMNPV